MQKVTNLMTKADDLKLRQAYMKSCSDPFFRSYIERIDLNDEVLMHYTSRLEDVLVEQKHCHNCSALQECKNIVPGHVLTALKIGNALTFSYVPCPFLEQQEKMYAYQQRITCYDLPKEIKRASFQDIYKDDKSRVPIIKYFQEFTKGYLKGEKPQGLYLHGSFGSGKSYLIAALFNELAKRGISSALVYYPELLRGLKASFGSGYEERFEFLKRVPLLLLDDVGAENTTAWSRDEVLGPLLQFRMDEHLPTFFTSNLTLAELEKSLSVTSNGVDKIKAKRISERIKQLARDMELVSKNRR